LPYAHRLKVEAALALLDVDSTETLYQHHGARRDESRLDWLAERRAVERLRHALDVVGVVAP
jgi:hypothetical protein